MRIRTWQIFFNEHEIFFNEQEIFSCSQWIHCILFIRRTCVSGNLEEWKEWSGCLDLKWLRASPFSSPNMRGCETKLVINLPRSSFRHAERLGFYERDRQLHSGDTKRSRDSVLHVVCARPVRGPRAANHRFRICVIMFLKLSKLSNLDVRWFGLNFATSLWNYHCCWKWRNSVNF